MLPQVGTGGPRRYLLNHGGWWPQRVGKASGVGLASLLIHVGCPPDADLTVTVSPTDHSQYPTLASRILYSTPCMALVFRPVDALILALFT
jgi:hypothetical protein